MISKFILVLIFIVLNIKCSSFIKDTSETRSIALINQISEKKTLCFNGDEILSKEDFYKKFSSFDFVPEYFGNNLDAVWDVLHDSSLGNFELDVIWLNSDISLKKIPGNFFNSISKLFQDAQKDDSLNLKWSTFTSNELKNVKVICE